jgi:hypothetical protein
MIRPGLLIVIVILAGCSYGSLSEKDLSKNNITDVELNFPKSQQNTASIYLYGSQLSEFADILNQRKAEFVEPDNCYNLTIKLKDGGSVSYRTDGNKFQGYDDTSDRPFSFSVERNILTEVFKLKELEHCP